jgi:hypothetical protein
VLRAILSSIDGHMGGCWEDAFRDYLRRHAETIHPETVTVGPWWRAGGQDQSTPSSSRHARASLCSSVRPNGP